MSKGTPQLPLRIDGMEVKFYSNDHMPPHFHVQRKGEWKITVRFLTSNSKLLDYTLDWKKTKEGPNRSDIERIINYIIINRDSIVAKWNVKYDQEK
jgi:hypothetical protein